MKKKINALFFGLFLLSFGSVLAQNIVKPDTQVEPDNLTVEADLEVKKDTTRQFKRIKLDGIAAVVGDYVILDSDIEKTLIDLRSQGASTEDVTPCGLLGKLMEDRLYAHMATQDSIIIADDDVYATSDRQIQNLVSQIGSMEKLLKFYKKEDEKSFRDELFEINKLRMLSERMQGRIIEEIEITPEEVRQFFNKIPEGELPQFGAELEIAQIVKEPIASDLEKQKVIDQLNAIKADIEDNGSSFGVKAILYSKDKGQTTNGGFYRVTKQSQFVKEFKDVAFSLKEGEISEPFESSFGFHIMHLKKIRGQERDVSHILLHPEIPQSAIDKAKAELDSVRQKVLDGEITFGDAALQFSDEKETKYDGGLLRNPTNFDSRFELTRMDPELYNQVRDLKDNEISRPILEEDPRSGAVKFKILRITNRYDEHIADFAKDYIKIQELALREKQFKAIKSWMSEHIEDTYINVNAGRRDCNFANNWVKE